MLPRLRAEEELAEIQHGHAYVERPMQQRARGQYIASLEGQRTGGSKGPRKLGPGDVARIQHMGIPVKRQGKEAE
jgi:hypothetical protein